MARILKAWRALIGQFHKLPEKLMRTLTGDRGTELAQHKAFTESTDVQVYCCDPRSPWQRGSNENTNGLAAPVPAKKRKPVRLQPAVVERHSPKLNTRPRKTLGYIAPADKLAAALRRPVELTLGQMRVLRHEPQKPGQGALRRRHWPIRACPARSPPHKQVGQPSGDTGP